MRSNPPRALHSCGAGLALVAAISIAIGVQANSGRHSLPTVYAASGTSPAVTKNGDPDAACRGCHEKIYDSYKRTSMAMGSGRAVDGLDRAELAANDLAHMQSGVTYHVAVRGKGRDEKAFLTFSRPATSERQGLAGEHQIDYFVGSGRRGRTFLYQQEGLWFEAPINWYGKKQLWDMAPAYEGARAMPDPLPVDANCLHCHTGDAQPASGPARNHYTDAPFRSAIGCAACHGDPAAHLAGVNGGKPGTGPILNPNKLDAVRRDSACIQCHLEGDAAVYLPGKSLAAFKPGDDLSKSVVYFIDSSKAQLGRRASSQYEALLRSACKRASGDKLTCTTCHDPHSSPAPEERVAFFRGKCLACHTSPQMPTRHHPEQQDCAVCHMPTRTTRDISHEQLTDHDIEARSNTSTLALSDLSGPAKRDLVAVGGFAAGDRELGLAYAQLAQHGDRSSGERALQLLTSVEHAGANDIEVHDQLGFLLQLSGSANAAAEEYVTALQQRPQDTTAAANLAVLDASKGQVAEAMRLLAKVVEEDPSQTAAGLNLAFLECRLNHKADAMKTVERMLVFNPDSPAAHRLLDTGSYGNQHCQLR